MVDFEWLEGRSRRRQTQCSNEPGRTLAGESASLAARFSSAVNDVLVTFYILWFIELFQFHIYHTDADMFGEFSLGRATDRRRALAWFCSRDTLRQSTIGRAYKQITT
jgi:hypothetical protein